MRYLKNRWGKLWTKIGNYHYLRLLFSIAFIIILLSLFWMDSRPFSPSIPNTPQHLADSQLEQNLPLEIGLAENEEHDLSAFPDYQEINDSHDALTVLLIGVDNRPGEEYLSNTDTLIVANLNKKSKQIALLSIPRDTQIKYKHHGITKINSVARLGGSYQETSAVVEKLIGQKIDGFVVSNFAGFKEIVDIVGGITLDVEKDMYYQTGDHEDGEINLKKGVQRLNGSQALQYARFRNDELADIARTVRQQKVLKALAAELFQVKNITKLPQIIRQVYQMVDTNLALSELLSFANVFIRIDDYKIISQTLPGKFAIEDDISYWKINIQESQQVCKKLFFEGQTTSMFSERVTVVEEQPTPTKSPNNSPPANPSILSSASEFTSKSAPKVATEEEKTPSNNQPNKQVPSDELTDQTGKQNLEERSAEEHIIFEVEQL